MSTKYLHLSKGSWAGGLFLIGAGLGVLSSGIKNAPKLTEETSALNEAIKQATKVGGGVLVKDGRFVVIPPGYWGK